MTHSYVCHLICIRAYHNYYINLSDYPIIRLLLFISDSVVTSFAPVSIPRVVLQLVHSII